MGYLLLWSNHWLWIVGHWLLIINCRLLLLIWHELQPFNWCGGATLPLWKWFALIVFTRPQKHLITLLTRISLAVLNRHCTLLLLGFTRSCDHKRNLSSLVKLNHASILWRVYFHIQTNPSLKGVLSASLVGGRSLYFYHQDGMMLGSFGKFCFWVCALFGVFFTGLNGVVV